MKTTIVAGLEGSQRAEMEANYKASALFRERLRCILKDKIESKRKEQRSDASFTAQWAYKQANALGYETALLEFISLLE